AEHRRPAQAAIHARPDLHRRGDRDLPAAVAPAGALCRGDPGAVQGDAALPGRRHRRQGALYRRRRRLGGGRQIDHRARVAGEAVVVDRPDILIVEGLNVLMPNRLTREGRETPFVSDFFDFSVFLDASEELLEKWYVERFMRLRDTAFRDPRSFFKKFAELDD